MASYQVTVIDAEGTETIVEVPDDQYILDAIEAVSYTHLTLPTIYSV